MAKKKLPKYIKVGALVKVKSNDVPGVRWGRVDEIISFRTKFPVFVVYGTLEQRCPFMLSELSKPTKIELLKYRLTGS